MQESVVHPRVRVLHAAPSAPALDVFVGGSLHTPGLAYGQVSGYVSLRPDRHRLRLFPAGQHRPEDVLVDEGMERLKSGLEYTIVAVGELRDLRIVLVEDCTPLPVMGRGGAPAPDVAKVRILHASPDAPALDVGVTGSPELFRQVGFTEVSPFRDVESGTYDIHARRAGHDAVVAILPRYAFVGGSRYTLVALGLVDGQPPIALMPVIDALVECPAI